MVTYAQMLRLFVANVTGNKWLQNGTYVTASNQNKIRNIYHFCMANVTSKISCKMVTFQQILLFMFPF